MIKGKVFCLVVLFTFFNSKSAGLRLGSFFNSTDKPVELVVSSLRDTNKFLPSRMPTIKIRVAKDSSIKLDQFSFETPEGPASGFLITYYLLGQKKPLKYDISIKYKYLVIDEKNCSKCGLCPSGYMASVYLGSKLYKNVYSPISQKSQGVIDLILTPAGLQLSGNVQVLDPENGLLFGDPKTTSTKKLMVSLF